MAFFMIQLLDRDRLADVGKVVVTTYTTDADDAANAVESVIANLIPGADMIVCEGDVIEVTIEKLSDRAAEFDGIGVEEEREYPTPFDANGFVKVHVGAPGVIEFV